MGLFCVSMHFRTSSEKALQGAVGKRGMTKCRILKPKKGWVSFYEEQVSQQDDARIKALVGELSGELKVPAIAFLVHDSDIACYWLYENGQLLDHFNSCPDYFEAGPIAGSARGGEPAVLARFARQGTKPEAIASMLAQECVFAENLVEQLAEALGIDPDRALADFGDDPAEGGGDDEEEAGDSSAGGAVLGALRARMAGQFTQPFVAGQQVEKVDPQVQALVEAAGMNDVGAIGKALDEGAIIDAEARIQFPGIQAMEGMSQLYPNGLPKISMNALQAAVTGKHRQATQLLLARGADPNCQHQLYGTALHIAAGAGEAEILQLLLENGADPATRNLQQLTPMQVLAAGKANVERMQQAQEMMKTMRMKTPGMNERFAAFKLPIAGWAACEKLLRERGAS
ncbi:hypothetical protein BH10PLA2_BH10PLA2_13490 [soil metagenome]